MFGGAGVVLGDGVEADATGAVTCFSAVRASECGTVAWDRGAGVEAAEGELCRALSADGGLEEEGAGAEGADVRFGAESTGLFEGAAFSVTEAEDGFPAAGAPLKEAIGVVNREGGDVLVTCEDGDEEACGVFTADETVGDLDGVGVATVVGCCVCLAVAGGGVEVLLVWALVAG